MTCNDTCDDHVHGNREIYIRLYSHVCTCIRYYFTIINPVCFGIKRASYHFQMGIKN